MKILLSLDGSPTSEVALGLAESLCRSQGAELLLARITDPLAAVAPGTMPSLSLRLDEHLQEAAGAYLESLRSRLEGVSVRVHNLLGSPRETLPQVALQEKVDLIVMASHGRSGMARWLLGSVAESVLRQSPCPVLLIRPEAAPKEAQFKHVLVPIDGSALSQDVLQRLPRLIPRAPGAKITLLRASGLSFQDHAGVIDAFSLEQFMQHLEEEIRQLSVEGFDMDYRVVDGEAADAILTLASELGCDLVAMSTHGRSGIKRFLLGSVTEKVARRVHCPVLAFPHRPE